MYVKTSKYKIPYLDSAVYIIYEAAQIQQISSKSDSGDVRHAEKSLLCSSYKNLFFWQSTGPILGIREPTPFPCLLNYAEIQCSFKNGLAALDRKMFLFEFWEQLKCEPLQIQGL